jgi:LPXTG-motif cell wall-anchored protein
VILRRFASVLGLALVLAGVAATPAHAEPVHSGLGEIIAPAEFPQGYLWKINLRGGAGGTGADPQPVDRSRVSITLTIPDGVTYAPGEGTTSGPCDLADGLLTCRPAEDGPVDQFGWYIFPVELRVGEDTPLGTRLPFRLNLDVEDGQDTFPNDNTRTWTSTVAGSADMGVAVKDLVVAEDAVTYTVVLHNYGPQTTTKYTYHETYSVTNWHGTGVGPGATCRFTAGKNQCTVRQALAPGQESEIKRTVPIPANSKWRGTKVPVEVYVYDSPANFAGSEWFVNTINPDNDKTSYVADLTALAPPTTPSPTPSASPSSPGGTAAPAPGEGGGGGLPITGSATLPVAVTGLGLLLAGAAAVLVARRRRA